MRLLALRAETMQAMRRLKLPCDDITPIGLWGSDMYLIGVNNEQFEVLRLWNVQTEDITPATLRDFHTESPAVPTTPSAGNAASDARFTATETSPRTSPSFSSIAVPSAARPASPAPARPLEPPSAPVRGRQAEGLPHTPPHAAPAPSVAPVTATAVPIPTPESPTPDPFRINGAGNAPASSDRPLAFESNTGGATARGARSDEPKGSKATRAAAAAAAVANAAATAAATAAADADVRQAPPKDKQESGAGKLRMTVDGEHLYAEIKGGKIVLKDRTYDSLAHARDSIRRERNKDAVWEYFDEGVKAWRVLNRD